MFKKQFLEAPKLHYSNIIEDWRGSDTEERHAQIKNNTSSIYKLGEFKYKNNNRGFRCDDFEDWGKYPIRILFAGASIAEGIGSPIEHTWTNIVHKMICEKLNVKIPFWSIASGGTGTDHMLRYLYHEGETLRPQLVIAQLPYLERRERWHDDYWIPGIASDKEIRTHKAFLTPEFISYQTEKNLAMIDMLMKRWNSLFLFFPEDSKFFIDLPLVRQLNVNPIYNDYGRDMMHPGPKSHQGIAEQVFEDCQKWLNF